MTQNISVNQSKIWRMAAQGMLWFVLDLTLKRWQITDALANNPCLKEFERSGTLRQLLKDKVYTDLSWQADDNICQDFINAYIADRTYAPMYNPVIPPQPVNVILNSGIFTWEFSNSEDETLWQDIVICEVFAYSPSKSMFIYVGTDADTYTRAGQYVLVLRQVTWGLDEEEPPNTIITSHGAYGAPSIWQVI